MVRIKKQIGLLILVVLLLVNLVYAVPPFTTDTSNDLGLNLRSPQADYYPYGQNVSLIFHVHNKTDGILLGDSVSCAINIYNSTGDLIVNNNSITHLPSDQGFVYQFNTDTIRSTTQTPYHIYCNNSNQGGSQASELRFNYFGIEPASDLTNVMLMIGFIVLVCAYLVTFFKMVSTMLSEETDILDVVYSFCVLLTITSLYYFNQIYGGNALIDQVTVIFIKVGGATHGVFPAFAFFFTLLKRKWREARKDTVGGHNG